MDQNTRILLFAISGTFFAVLFAWGIFGLPAVGHYRGPYGDVITAIVVPQRHITDAVTAVNFDFRGFDTLGEEFIMFVSVAGVAVLLRRHPEEEDKPPKDKAKGRQVPLPSDAVRFFTIGLIGPLTLFGLYIATHGQLTPGGGFQGGVVLATAPLLIYLAGDFARFKRVAPHAIVEIVEALGAGGYGIIGIAAFLAGAPFLTNVLPLGMTGDVFSGGTVLWIDLAVGMEVAGGFLVLMSVFLQEALELHELR